MGKAHDAHAAGETDEAKLIEEIKELRIRNFERPLEQIKSGLNQLIAKRLADAALSTPLLDADDIATQDAALQGLIDAFAAVTAQAEAFIAS